jgi:hypothetical protein
MAVWPDAHAGHRAGEEALLALLRRAIAGG